MHENTSTIQWKLLIQLLESFPKVFRKLSESFPGHVPGILHHLIRHVPTPIMLTTTCGYRSVDNQKRFAMTTYLEDLLNCNAGRLPLETLTHRFIAVSKALQGFWNCTKDLSVSMLRLRTLLPASSCETIEFDDESDLRIVRCQDVYRFLRGLHKEKLGRGQRGVEMFQNYLDQLEDSELRRSVIGLCGDFWRLQVDASDVEFMDEEVGLTNEDEDDFQMTTKPPFIQPKSRCRTIQMLFSQFLSAAWYTRSLSDQAMCQDVLRSSCSRANIVVAGIHRASMSDLELLIQRMPDVHLVFYVRDPRAIAVSRADPLTLQTYLNYDNWTAVNESEFLCRRMWDDLEAKKRLEGRYPGSILTVRYEDFILDPRGTVTRMYTQFQRDVPEGFDRWVNETLNTSTYDGIFGIHRPNSKEHISKWRSKVSIEERREMTRHCFKVLKHFGYLI